MSPSRSAACPCRVATCRGHPSGWARLRHAGDARTVLLGVLEHTFAIPLGNEAERVRVGVLDTHALQVRIEVRDVDELGAALVGRLSGCARLLLESDLGPDQHDLAFLHVRTVDGELGEASEAAGHEVGARWASPLPKETLARPISVIRTNTSSPPTTPAATRLRLISASNDFLTSSSRPSRKVISMISNWSV